MKAIRGGPALAWSSMSEVVSGYVSRMLHLLFMFSVTPGFCQQYPQWPQPRHSFLAIKTMQPVTAFLGDTVTLTCEGMFEWEAVELYWLYDGLPVQDVRPMYTVVETMNPAETLTQNVLTISRAGPRDAGQFSCASYDMPGWDTIQVDIITDPELRPSPDIVLQEGMSFTLTCTVVPWVPRATMYWLRRGRLIGTTGLHDFDGDLIPDGEISRDGALVVYSAETSDAGEYTCLLRYVASKQSRNAAKTINVNANVEVHVEEYIKLNSPLFEPIKITCTSHGYPLPHITWSQRNFTLGGDGYWGRSVAITTRQRSAVTVISELVISDLPGSFAMASVRCEASNFFSNASQLSLIIKFGNGTTALLDGTTLDENALIMNHRYLSDETAPVASLQQIIGTRSLSSHADIPDKADRTGQILSIVCLVLVMTQMVT